MNSWRAFFTASCWGPLISAAVGGALVYLASWILAVSGLLFNWALTETVLQFGSLVNNNIVGSITTAWSVFRDISNILIIGMFTFIAINIILGNKTYGEKKLIARVLVVAVLINFSLLFTKIIIDASNFVSVQFYNSAAASNADLAGTQNTPTAANFSQVTAGTQQAGVAGAFMRYAGVAGFGDTAQAIYNQSKYNSSWSGLLFGVVTALLFLAAAIVLFYGTFLLISRALLMIFLMITSSIAFASYLIPSAAESSYGWNAWWSSLLKNAVFAPLLVVLLWVTLTVAQNLKVAQGSVGDLITNPSKTLDINALFGYVLIVGLLFIAIKVSSSFATQVGGFNIAQGGLSTPFAAFNRFLAAPAARKVFGGWAARRSLKKEDEIGKEKLEQAKAHQEGKPFDTAKLYNLQRQKAKLDTKAGRSYDLMNTKTAQTIGGALGVAKPLLKDRKGSYADDFKKRADEAAKKGAELSVSKADAEKAAKEQIDRERESGRQMIDQQRKNGAELVEGQKKAAEELKRSLEPQRAAAQSEAENTERDAGAKKEDIKRIHDDIIKQLQQDIQSETDPGRSTVMKNQLEARRAQRENELKAEDERISKAKGEVERIQSRINDADKPVRDAEKSLSEHESRLKDFDAETRKLIEKRTNDIQKAAVENAQAVAELHAKSTMQRLLGLSPDEAIAKKARSLTKKKIDVKPLKERASASKEVLDEAGEGGGDKKEDKKEDDHH